MRDFQNISAIDLQSPATMTQGFWDKAITFRQLRNCLIICMVFGGVWYVWQFFRYAAHSEIGGGGAISSPFIGKIPQECHGAADRHLPTNSAGVLADKFAMRLRPLRIPADKYLNPDYGRIRCLGYAVLTGLHMTDPLDANFTDTYTDAQGAPIVRITVEYLQPYSYNPAILKPLSDQGRQ